MAFRNYFDELWALDWGVGIFFNPPKFFETFYLATSDLPFEYFNYIGPRVNDPKKLNLDEVDKQFKQLGLAPAIYLTENQQRAGFVEHLVRNGYKFASSECWVGLDPENFVPAKQDIEIKKVTTEEFKEFRSVADEVWKNEKTQLPWSNTLQQTLTGSKHHSGVVAEYFVIYENSAPMSVGGLFYSLQDNFAYLHTDATLHDSRGKGNQKQLISQRVEVCLKNKIDRIYAITERGTTSWANYIKLGFNEIQQLLLLKK